MEFHWAKKRLTDSDSQKRYVIYLFDQNGRMHGRVENSAKGIWHGYNEGAYTGFFDTSTAAKRAVLTEAKFRLAK